MNKGPFQSKLSFRLLKEKYEELSVSKNPVEKFQSELALKLFQEHSFLNKVDIDLSECEEKSTVIEQLMGFLFPVALTTNEIKTAIYPLTNYTFYKSERMLNVLEDSIYNMDEIFKMLFKDHIDGYDLIPYAYILNSYYNYNIDLSKPKALKVINKDGSEKNYRVTFNADFMDIYPNENAVEITPEILDELLADAHNKDVWNSYFPENSWTVEGFGIVSMTDTTVDETINEFKTHLIQPNKESFSSLVEDIRRIFGIPDLQLGSYGFEHNKLIPPYDENFKMLTLESEDSIDCKSYACDYVYDQLFVENKPVILSNLERYHKQTGGNTLSETLLKQNFKSAVLIPIVVKGNLEFILEMACYKTNQLNAINIVKLDALMPFILSYSARTITEHNNEISAVIQEECTSIHPSVEWRFQEEANRFIQKRNMGESPSFHEIMFKDVLPLYGQIDIVGSSSARNQAIQADFKEQLTQAKKILQKRIKQKNLPFYEHLVYQIDKFLYDLDENFHTSTEQEINTFFSSQIFPLFKHLLSSERNSTDIKSFNDTLDGELNSVYNARSTYDQTVNLVNRKLSSFMDKQQEKAQEMFPHYFEKFKTDGIEHNLYIGQSITQTRTFHKTDLYNLRLWQLQVVCEMEAMYYQNQKEFPLQLDVASLILVYDVPLTIRYRMDEKQFDVDGAYNVRYEMIKKRIDKANIKNTNERLTQPHKLSVVYSSNEIEREYLNYFEFLQSKNYIGDNIEIVELEELQGASGIKAIRVDINHHLPKSENLFTVKDLEIVE